MTASRMKTAEVAGPEAPIRQPTRAPSLSAPARPTPLSRGFSVAAGNLATQRLLRAGASQPTAIGNPRDDPAGRAAMAVMSQAPMLSRQPRCTCGGVAGPGGECAECRASRLMLKPETASARPGIAPPIVHRVLGAGGGKPLDPALRHGFEARLGHDLAAVRLHTGGEAAASARAVNARAYSVGRDIVFGSGAYAPGTDRGQRLLAHELTHTIQQSGSRPVGLRRALEVGPVDDASEREAEAVADTIGPLRSLTAGAHQPSPSSSPSMVRRAWYDRIAAVGEAAWGGAKWVGGKVASGAEATWEGAQWVGGKAVDIGEAAWEGAERIGGIARDEVKRVMGATWACAKATGSAIWRPISLDLFREMASKPSVSGLLGVPRPQNEGAPGILDTIISIVKHPCLRMIPGYTHLAGIVAKLPAIRDFLATAWKIMQNPSAVLDSLQAALGGLIAQVPDRARALARGAITFSEPRQDHLGGIWRHLEPKLEYLAANWWDVIKETGGSLLWPLPNVWKNLGEIWDHTRGAVSAVWDLEFSEAIDHLTAIWRKGNEALGHMYGWISLLAILVGTVFGGPGGFMAGVKFALSLGKGLLISTIAAETISIAKAGHDLTFTKQTREEQEEDFEQIANSGLTLGITGAMVLLGALAVRFAGALISRVAGIWRRPPPPGGAAPPAAPGGEPVVLYDASGRQILVSGGEIVPSPASTRPVVLQSPQGTPLRGPGSAAAPEAGPVLMFDAQGRPIQVTGGQATPISGGTTLTGESRLVSASGQPISGSPGVPPAPLLDQFGRPVISPLTGPTIVDLQAGMPTFLQGMVGRVPGARGIGVESGRWLLGYQGVYPTNPLDLGMALQIARQGPIWPNTPAWRTPLAQTPRLLPWEMNPAAYLFPETPPVSILPEAFFPAVGQQGRLVPFNIRDIPQGGILPSTHPRLYNLADQIYVRRPFGLAMADAATTRAMGQEINRMLKPGGFVEFRLRAQTELTVSAAAEAVPDQVAAIAGEINGARIVRVDRGAIQRFQRTGELPSDPVQADILRNAASDIQGLGQGAYSRIIRIYKSAETGTTGSPLGEAATAALSTSVPRGVVPEMFPNLPPDHPVVKFRDAVRALMTAAGVVASEEVTEEATVEAAAP